MCATKAGASNFISISMLADGKAPPAPPYYGIIEVQGWGTRGMTTSQGDVGREKLRGEGEKKRGFVTIGDHFGHPPPSHPRLQSRLIVTALGRTPELSELVSRMETIRDFEHLFELISMYWWRVKIMKISFLFLVILIVA